LTDSGAPANSNPHFEIKPQATGRVGAAAESEDEEFVATVVMIDEPLVVADDFVFSP
jgi:hypothetical protein